MRAWFTAQAMFQQIGARDEAQPSCPLGLQGNRALALNRLHIVTPESCTEPYGWGMQQWYRLCKGRDRSRAINAVLGFAERGMCPWSNWCSDLLFRGRQLRHREQKALVSSTVLHFLGRVSLFNQPCILVLDQDGVDLTVH